MPRFHFRRISDAVYGTFGISELEADIISTRSFQRLHNIRQLGLAYLVYPDLNYSRFAHSLGACHVAGRMMRAISANCHKETDDKDIQLYRLAGLLHDLGHYPFSHTLEHVVQDHYKEKAFLKPAADAAKEETELGADLPAALGHEMLGRHIIDLDPEINDVFKKHGISASDVKAVFSRETPGVLVSLVSSDLDCDRLDYLVRTARHAGLPYGVVDAEYIVGQTCVDGDGHLCLTDKALRAADHLLVSRYFDYTQVVFHKTVVALETVLSNVSAKLLEVGMLDLSAKHVDSMISDASFARLDDNYLIECLRELEQSIGDKSDPLKVKLNSVLHRIPPKLVASSERIEDRDKVADHKNRVAQLRDKMDSWAKEFGIHRDLWHLWEISLPLTKIGSHVPLSTAVHGDIEEAAEQAVRILTDDPLDPKARSKPLIEFDYALTKQLSNTRFYAVRVYVHLGDDARDLRKKIEQRIRADLPHFPFRT